MIKFTLPGEAVPSIEICEDGTFNVNGRKVGKDSELFHAAIKFFGAVEDWKNVENDGYPEVDQSVWFYECNIGVQYGKYTGGDSFSSTLGFSHRGISHWMLAPEAPIRYMEEDSDD